MRPTTSSLICAPRRPRTHPAEQLLRHLTCAQRIAADISCYENTIVILGRERDQLRTDRDRLRAQRDQAQQETATAQHKAAAAQQETTAARQETAAAYQRIRRLELERTRLQQTLDYTRLGIQAAERRRERREVAEIVRAASTAPPPRPLLVPYPPSDDDEPCDI